MSHELSQIDLAGDFDVAGIGWRGQRSGSLAVHLHEIRHELELLDVEFVARDQHVGLAVPDAGGERVARQECRRRDRELRGRELADDDVLRLAVVGPDVAGIERELALWADIGDEAAEGPFGKLGGQRAEFDFGLAGAHREIIASSGLPGEFGGEVA